MNNPNQSVFWDKDGTDLSLRSFVRLMAQLINLAGPIEKFFWKESSSKLLYKPILIIGPPRSGTTLLSQMVPACFDLCYWSNFSTCLYQFPMLSAKLNSLLEFSNRKETFESEYGKTQGLLGQCEASLFWDQWVPRKADSTMRAEQDFEQTIAVYSNTCSKPFVGKSVFASTHIPKISRMLSRVLIVVPLRNPFFIAQSILIARRKKRVEQFSVLPNDFPSPSGCDELIGSVYQCVGLYKNIVEGLSLLDSSSYVCVPYHSLCENPKEWMATIRTAYEKEDDRLTPRPFELQSMQHANTIRINEEETKRLKDNLAQLWPPVAKQFENLNLTSYARQNSDPFFEVT